MIDWSTAFDSATPNARLAADELARQLAALRAPFTDAERAEIAERFGLEIADVQARNPIDELGLPGELLDLYRWCDGGELSVGDRHFAPLLRLAEIREYMVTYGVCHALPGHIPIGMDGNACFYLVDLRQRPATVKLGGMNDLDQPGCVGELAGSIAALFADRRDPISVAGL